MQSVHSLIFFYVELLASNFTSIKFSSFTNLLGGISRPLFFLQESEFCFPAHRHQNIWTAYAECSFPGVFSLVRSEHAVRINSLLHSNMQCQTV